MTNNRLSSPSASRIFPRFLFYPSSSSPTPPFPPNPYLPAPTPHSPDELYGARCGFGFLAPPFGHLWFMTLQSSGSVGPRVEIVRAETTHSLVACQSPQLERKEISSSYLSAKTGPARLFFGRSLCSNRRALVWCVSGP